MFALCMVSVFLYLQFQALDFEYTGVLFNGALHTDILSCPSVLLLPLPALVFSLNSHHTQALTTWLHKCFLLPPTARPSNRETFRSLRRHGNNGESKSSSKPQDGNKRMLLLLPPLSVASLRIAQLRLPRGLPAGPPHPPPLLLLLLLLLPRPLPPRGQSQDQASLCLVLTRVK